MTGREPDLPAHAHPPHRRRRVPRCLVHGPAPEAGRQSSRTTTTTDRRRHRPRQGRDGAAKQAAAHAATAAATKPGPPATTAAPDRQGRRAAPIAIPAEALAKLPKDVAGALKARKVLVLGVFADGATAVAPDGRRRPLRPQRPARRQPLRRRRVVKHVAALQALHLRLAGQRPRRQPVPERRRHRPRPQGPRARPATSTASPSTRRSPTPARDSDRRRTSPTPTCARLNELCGALRDCASTAGRYPTVRGKKAADGLAASAAPRSSASTAARSPALDAPAKWRSLKKPRWLTCS